MAMQTLTGGIMVPAMFGYCSEAINNPPAYDTDVIDADGEKVALIFRASKTGNISYVGWRTGTVTTSNSIDIRVETIAVATGLPTGTLATANASATRASVSSDTWYWEALTAAAAVTQGTWYAVVIQFTSFVAGSLQVASSSARYTTGAYHALYTTSWAKDNETPTLGLQYDDNSFDVCGTAPFSACGSEGFGNDDSPNHRGLKFQLPFPARLRGVFVWARISGGADVKFTSDGGASWTTIGSMDKDIVPTVFEHCHLLVASSGISLSKDTWYRIVLVPTTTTNDTLSSFSVTKQDTYNPMEQIDGGTSFIWTQANDPDGAPTADADWTDTDTKRALITLILDQFDDGAGGSGGNMNLIKPAVL